MRKNKEKRTTDLPHIRLTPTEKASIKTAFLASDFPTQSAFIRAKLLCQDKKINAQIVRRQQLKSAELVDELQKIEQAIHDFAGLRQRIKTNVTDKKELLSLASIIYETRKIIKIVRQTAGE